MVKKANQFKKGASVNTTGRQGGRTRKKNKTKSFRSVRNFFTDPRLRRIAGLFLIFFSVVLLISMVSYFFTWKMDNTIVSGDQPANWTGRAGRWISQLFIEKGFGVSSLVFVLLFFIYGVKLMFRRTLLPLWKTTRISIVLVVFSSVSLGFLFGSFPSFSFLPGSFGIYIDMILDRNLGKIGAGILLLFLWLSFFIIVLNRPFKWFTGRNRDKKDGKGSGGPPPEDLYNTAEYAVEDEMSHEEGKEDEREETAGVEEFEIEPINEDDEVKKTDSITKDGENQHDDIELTIEKTVEEDNSELNDSEAGVVDEATQSFDPRLDLPHYKFPTLDLLEEYGRDTVTVRKEELERNKNRIVETLGNYSITIQKIKATIGPTVTLYEIVPAPGVRISKIKNLEDDIALSLSALGIRIIAPIPGKGTIGIEVPNENPEIVSMKSILASEKFNNNKFDLPFGVGKTVSNESFVADLAKMPHILMAGATGQGKSVGLNVVIASLLYKKHPAEIKFILVDPKKVELTLYSKIERHFLAKLPDSEEAIITDTRKVVRTLNSLSIEMDNRYELLKDAQVRNVKEYNVKFTARKLNPLHGHRYLPYIVLVIDEFADLIMTAGKEIEGPITRLAQLARAVGIHLIIATQRPSVNIITGSIKANFPARIAFRVISKIDSRTILDSSGADQLIGRGDMLLSTGSDLLRLQCAFVDTHEVDRVTDFIGSQRAYPDAYHLPDYQDEESEGVGDFDPNERDELFEEAARIIVQTQQGSTSLLQRKLKLGYNRAGRIIDQLEAAGIVGPFEGSKAREVKVANEMALEQFLRDIDNKD